MNIKVNFTENNQGFSTSFGEMYLAPDENYNKGFEAGLSDGYDNGYAIGEAEGYKDGEAAGYESGVAAGYASGEVAGRDAEHNEFWDGILSGGNWQNKFCGSSWNDNTFYPTKDLVCGQYANNLFQLCEITDLAGRLRECGVKLDTTKATRRIDYMFNYATKLTTAPYIDVSNCTHSSSLACMFMQCNALKTIEGIRVSDDGLQGLGGSTFGGCRVLENITFYGAIGSNLDFSDCVKLTRASIENIVEHLADNATGKKLTMSKTAATKAFTTEEWDALIATKPNWTIVMS